MSSPKCVHCGLYNFAEAIACKRCQQPILYGSDAPRHNQENQIENPGSTQNTGGADMLIGGVTCLIGIVVTAATYSMASSSSGGGKYVIAWGAIVFGGIRFLKGLFGSD